MVVTGAWFLFIGWNGFNMGSTLVAQETSVEAARVAIITNLGGATSACLFLLFHLIFPRHVHFDDIFNSLLAGLSAMTSCCGWVPIWAAFPIGAGASMVFLAVISFLRYLRIDDPVDCIAIHLGGGAVGVLSVGLFADPDQIAIRQHRDSSSIYQYGAFLGGGGMQFAVQLLGLVVGVAWTLFWTLCILYPCSYFGFLRAPPETEVAGLDNGSAGGSAYPDFKLK